MFDTSDLVKLIKKAAVDAVNASKPADMVFGKVISVSPLKIKIDQKLILTSAQLVLTRNVSDYRLSVTMDMESESALSTHAHAVKGEDVTGYVEMDFTSGEANLSHTHRIKGVKELTVHNALKVDEEVILMQTSGGQKYIVIDRIGKG